MRHAQALSAKFRHRLKIAVVTKAEKGIAKTLNVTAYPALRVLPAGSSAGSSEAVHFTGKVSLFSIDLFLMDYAKPAASSARLRSVGSDSRAAPTPMRKAPFDWKSRLVSSVPGVARTAA